MVMVVRNTSTSTAILTICSGTGTSGSCIPGSSTFQPEATTSINLVPGAAGLIYSDATSSTGNYHAIPIATPFGGVNTQTSSYTATLLDKDKLIVMNCSSACALTLPASPPSSKWNIWAMSIGSTLATVSLNSLNFNGGASAPALIRYMPIMVRTDGSNYFGDAPLVAGSNITLTPAANGITVASSGGGGGGSTTFFQSPGVVGGSTFIMTATNRVMTSAVYIPPGTFSHLQFQVNVDDGTNDYDLGFYNSSGTLIAHVGAQTLPATGPTALAFSGAPITFAGGTYFFAMTGTSITGTISSLTCQRAFTANSTTASSGGVLPGTITPPSSGADTSDQYGCPNFTLY
jgi:hypothetical protein